MAWIFHLAFVFVISAHAQTAVPPLKPFNAALTEVLKSSEFQASQSEIRSIEYDFDSREIVLEPFIEVEGKRLNENRQLLNTASTTQKPRIDSLALTLSKPFSTGTLIKIGPRWENALTPTLNPDHRHTVDWNISLTQSLWKDFFGRSTRLRRAREEFQRKQQLAEALAKQGQVLIDFENLYWDWALALRESELQEKNLKRSREILKWTQDRFNRAAAESTDLLQAKALMTQRELQVSILQLTMTQVAARIERYLPRQQWRPDPKDLSLVRAPDQLTQTWKPDPLTAISQLQFLQAQNEALAEEQRANEERETIRPELNLQLSYGKNAIDPSSDAAIERSYKEDHDYSTVGLVLRTGLDLGSERKKVDAARASRDAAVQRRDAKQNENRIAWEQLKREIQDLQARIGHAHELVDLQTRKANAERERYRKGRSTAFQAITFEQDAAEAEITLWQLYALMRKTEARARLFAR